MRTEPSLFSNQPRGLQGANFFCARDSLLPSPLCALYPCVFFLLRHFCSNPCVYS